MFLGSYDHGVLSSPHYSIHFSGLTAYLIAACIIDFNRAITLLVIYLVVLSYNIYAYIRDKWGDDIYEDFGEVIAWTEKNYHWIKW